MSFFFLSFADYFAFFFFFFIENDIKKIPSRHIALPPLHWQTKIYLDQETKKIYIFVFHLLFLFFCINIYFKLYSYNINDKCVYKFIYNPNGWSNKCSTGTSCQKNKKKKRKFVDQKQNWKKLTKCKNMCVMSWKIRDLNLIWIYKYI